MSDLQNLINKLKVGNIVQKSYVYYNKDTGKIHKISSKNVSEDNYAIFEIASEEVKSILSGQRRIDEFIIFYDVSAKEVRLKEIAYEDNHKTASTMCYQLPIIKNTHEGHHSLTPVYEGADVYIWDNTHSYNKDQCVWYNGNVYKLATNIPANTEFDLTIHRIFVEDVYLTSLPTQQHTTKKLTMVPEYVGIHVDVWYKELSHLAGQHVWLNNTVYKLLNDQDVDTEFTMDNAEVIVSNVNLYADDNKSLKTVETISLGDIILNGNKLYSIQEVEQLFDKDKKSVFFYNTDCTLLYYNDKNCIEADLNDIHESVIINNIQLTLTDIQDLKNGQTILSGRQLYQVNTEKNYDIIVKQDTVAKCWNIIINPYTKKFLLNSGYNSKETLYFSITSKYNPNVFYRSLEFTVGSLLSDVASVIPFKYDAENNHQDVSIYTAKYFESYAHEII